MTTIEDVARTAHEVNRVVQQINGEDVSPPWAQAPEWQRQSALDGVHAALRGLTPEELHQNWLEHKASEGWIYGPVKDAEAKTHPCFVPYIELPEEQRVKDGFFHAVVNALGSPTQPSEPEDPYYTSARAEALRVAVDRLIASPSSNEARNAILNAAVDLGTAIELYAPAGRDKSLAWTHLEDTLMRANRAFFTSAS